MSQKYAIEQIKKALSGSDDNASQARQAIIAQAMEDSKLLQELVKPHMLGIVAHAIGRVQRGASEPEAVRAPTSAPTSVSAKPAPKDTAPKDKNDKDSFGLDILKSIAGGDSTMFGQEAYGRPMGKKGVSQKHIDAIQAMVKKTQGED